ncbi:hypothetical protein R3P38DRAFT_3209212 [Favolaschia claudopus]|uniref:Mediator of RNA polymerase II transcription subunit 7 n=1 Tax=Favolaschia claudopus TaxID=2862362 RepID=A0AAW0AIG9_9AGAR
MDTQNVEDGERTAAETSENTQNITDENSADVAFTFPPPRPIREMQAGVRQTDLEPFFLTGPDEITGPDENERHNPLELTPYLTPAQRAANRANTLETIAEFTTALHDFLIPKTDPLQRAEVALDQLLDHGELTEAEHAAMMDTNDIDEAERAWERLQAVLHKLCDAADARRARRAAVDQS